MNDSLKEIITRAMLKPRTEEFAAKIASATNERLRRLLPKGADGEPCMVTVEEMRQKTKEILSDAEKIADLTNKELLEKQKAGRK